MNGLICEENLAGHSLFLSFRIAIQQHFGINDFHIIKSKDDLSGIKRLFIIDEHFAPHLQIWKNLDFIKSANQHGIQVIAFNFEKIHSTQFPWNIEHQNALNLFKNLHQFVSDLEDAELLGKNVINKQLISSALIFDFPGEKQEKIIFLGQCNSYYPNRESILKECQGMKLPIDIHITDRKLSYQQYLQKLDGYKYVLNPLGTGEFINIRFYEALALGSIPIQQITSRMLRWYPELDFALQFKTPGDILAQVRGGHAQKKYPFHLEDYFNEINLRNIVA
jgi:hypothetical protein